MVAHAEAKFPNECCGAMIGSINGDVKDVTLAQPLENAYSGAQGARYELRPEDLLEADKDAVTLPEVLDILQSAIWSEVDKAPEGKFSARKPMISSLRRNLQREYIDRLIDVAHPTAGNSPASKTLATLARMYLRQVNGKIERALKAEPDVLDPYSKAVDGEVKWNEALFPNEADSAPFMPKSVVINPFFDCLGVHMPVT